MGVVLAAAAVVGLVAGLATGGSLTDLRRARVRVLVLLIAGAALQVAVLDGAIHLSSGWALAAILGSYAALAGFALANLSRPGMAVLFLGVVLNAIPIAVNDGMPVEAHAITSAKVANPADIPFLVFGAKRHLAGPSDHVRWLDDRIPDWLTHEVLSIGDLVIVMGTGAVVAGLVKRPTKRGR